MILTDEILEKITDAIAEDPDAPIILPDHAYDKRDRVIVLIDGLPTSLQRHLHTLLIRPLGYHERMWQPEGVDRRNVNPHIMHVIAGSKSPATHCHKGHQYEGNEAPPNSRGYRCLTCLKDSRPTHGINNRDKTECPEGHAYTEENTYLDSAGKRRCLICKRSRDREYRRTLRNRRKDTP